MPYILPYTDLYGPLRINVIYYSILQYYFYLLVCVFVLYLLYGCLIPNSPPLVLFQ